MLNVIILNVNMLNVVLLNVIMLNVVLLSVADMLQPKATSKMNYHRRLYKILTMRACSGQSSFFSQGQGSLTEGECSVQLNSLY